MNDRDLKPDNVIETCFFVGALAALATGERAHLDGELGVLAREGTGVTSPAPQQREPEVASRLDHAMVQFAIRGYFSIPIDHG